MQQQHPLAPFGAGAPPPYSPNAYPAPPDRPQQYPAQQYPPAQLYPTQPYPAQQYPPPAYPGASGAPAAGFGQSPTSAAHWMLPVGRSWQSIVAGYVALVAIVAWFLGPIALGLGIWALVKASHDGSHGRGRAIFAVVVGGLSSVLLLLLLATT